MNTCRLHRCYYKQSSTNYDRWYLVIPHGLVNDGIVTQLSRHFRYTRYATPNRQYKFYILTFNSWQEFLTTVTKYRHVMDFFYWTREKPIYQHLMELEQTQPLITVTTVRKKRGTVPCSAT